MWSREENTVYYNLNNELGQVVKIVLDKDGKGVSIVNQGPDLLLFRKLPDFELLCEIIARCMDYPDNTFHDAWESIRDEQVDLGLDSSIAAIVLENYIREQWSPSGEQTEHRIEDKPSELHMKQWSHGKEKGLIKENDTRFPQTPDAYAKELYKMKRSFGHIGIKIDKGRTGSRRTIIIDYNDWKDRDLKNDIKNEVKPENASRIIDKDFENGR